MLMQWFLLSLLIRHVPRPRALLICLVTAFVSPLTAFWSDPARFSCYAFVFAAFWCVDRANETSRPHLLLGFGAVIFAYEACADRFSLVFLPGFALLGVLAAMDPRAVRGGRFGRLASLALPLAFAIAVATAHLPALFAPGRPVLQPGNGVLLAREALPMLFAVRWPAGSAQPAGVGAALVWTAALLFMGACVAGYAFALRKSTCWETRSLAASALIVWASNVIAFLALPEAGPYACRDLAPLLYTAPFALAPAAVVVGVRRLAVLVCPFVLASVVAGIVDREAAGNVRSHAFSGSATANATPQIPFFEQAQ